MGTWVDKGMGYSRGGGKKPDMPGGANGDKQKAVGRRGLRGGRI